MNVKLLSILGFAVLAASPAMANPSCLQIGQIYNFNVIDNKTLVVEDNWHDKFKLSLMAPCINLTFKDRVGFKSIGGFSQLSCLSKGDDVLVHDPGFPQRCPIVSIVPYTAEMERADKAAAAAAKAKQQESH